MAWPDTEPCQSYGGMHYGSETRRLPVFARIGPGGIAAFGQALHQLRPAETESIVRRFDMDDMAQIAQPLQKIGRHCRFAGHLQPR